MSSIFTVYPMYPGLSIAASKIAIADKRMRPLMVSAPDKLVVHEIYTSIQGESTYAGLPCTFVRTTACNLRCRYCDTKHAFLDGGALSLDEVFARVEAKGVKLIEFTGGEPLLQQGSYTLMTRFADAGYTVLLETSGSVDIGDVDPRVVRVVDFKTPYSGEVDANLTENVAHLTARDEVKLVLADRNDYEWARDFIREYRIADRCEVLLSCVFGKLLPSDLVNWVLADGLAVRVQIQLHKVIWNPESRGV